MRFAWDYWPRYLDEQGLGRLKKFVVSRMISRLRLWDYYSSKRVDNWIANSQHVAARIAKFYGAKAEVINPPVQIDQLSPSTERGDYYVTLATLTPYKKIDVAIAACNQLKRPLIVIGEGFERAKLEAMAGPSIKFAGRVNDSQKAKLLGEARGLLVPQEEDFGIAMVEALASGTPVIAYGVGGAKEIVATGMGVLYQDNSVEGLIGAIKQAEAIKFDAASLRQQSLQYSSSNFAKQLTNAVERLHKNHVSA